jgi:hypothetical protein
MSIESFFPDDDFVFDLFIGFGTDNRLNKSDPLENINRVGIDHILTPSRERHAFIFLVDPEYKDLSVSNILKSLHKKGYTFNGLIKQSPGIVAVPIKNKETVTPPATLMFLSKPVPFGDTFAYTGDCTWAADSDVVEECRRTITEDKLVNLLYRLSKRCVESGGKLAIQNELYFYTTDETGHYKSGLYFERACWMYAFVRDVVEKASAPSNILLVLGDNMIIENVPRWLKNGCRRTRSAE